jgi:hypothetical protein
VTTTQPTPPTGAELEAARLLLERMGLRPEDLLAALAVIAARS